jgi:hypothetical protein
MDLRIVAREQDLVCVSDKTVDKVIGYAVRFEDGSWANLRSRRYTGSAPGRVFFLRAPADGVAAGAASLTHDLGRVVELTLEGGGGDVVVLPATDQGTIEVQGDAEFADAVKVERRAGHVRATWFASATAGGVVRCMVPDRCRLAVRAAGDAHVWIGGPAPELRAWLEDEASLVCERALDVDLELNGSGGAFVGLARGRARVRANASGSAVVAGGHLTALDAVVLSSGSIVVHATVEDALLSNSGSGALSVPAIAHLSERHGRGAGPLLAGRPPAPADEGW